MQILKDKLRFSIFMMKHSKEDVMVFNTRTWKYGGTKGEEYHEIMVFFNIVGC